MAKIEDGPIVDPTLIEDLRAIAQLYAQIGATGAAIPDQLAETQQRYQIAVALQRRLAQESGFVIRGEVQIPEAQVTIFSGFFPQKGVVNNIVMDSSTPIPTFWRINRIDGLAVLHDDQWAPVRDETTLAGFRTFYNHTLSSLYWQGGRETDMGLLRPALEGLGAIPLTHTIAVAPSQPNSRVRGQR